MVITDFIINGDTWFIMEYNSSGILETYQKESKDDISHFKSITLYQEQGIIINCDLNKERKIKALKHELTNCFICEYGLSHVENFSKEMVCDLVESISDFINEVVEKYKEAKEIKEGRK